MISVVRGKLIARIAARRRSEQGLTLIELLLSLAILAILTGFLAGGLAMARQAFGADRVSEIGSETGAAIQTVAALVGSALPVRADPATSKDATRPKEPSGFDGRAEAIAFVGLSEGRSLRGGPHKIVLQRSGSDLVADFTPFNLARPKDSAEPAAMRVVVLSGVRQIHIGYFGTLDLKVQPSWQADWTGAERLPDLVSIRIEFDDARRNEPAIVVALRQS